jgi:hypothetical protein
MTLTEQIHLCARIATMDRVVFCQLMSATIASQQSTLRNTEEAAWEGLMDQWWNRVSSLLAIIQPQSR